MAAEHRPGPRGVECRTPGFGRQRGYNGKVLLVALAGLAFGDAPVRQGWLEQLVRLASCAGWFR